MKNKIQENTTDNVIVKTQKDISTKTRCTICNYHGFAVVGNNGKVIDRLCGSCIKNVYGKVKPNQQTKLLL